MPCCISFYPDCSTFSPGFIDANHAKYAGLFSAAGIYDCIVDNFQGIFISYPAYYADFDRQVSEPAAWIAKPQDAKNPWNYIGPYVQVYIYTV